MALDRCNPVLLQIPDTCGCSVTQADLIAVTPEMLDDRDWQEEGLARVWASVKEGRLAGVTEKPLMDLFLSRMKPKARNRFSQSLVAPFYLEPSPAVINANYWEIEAGEQGASAKYWNITIKNSSSPWATDLAAIERYFLADHYVAIHFVDSDGVGRTITPKVISAANADSGGTYKATLVVEAPKSDAGWAALTDDEKAVYQPTGGVVQPLGNAISDRESWCYNHPSNLNWKWRDGWWQTLRNTHCVNEEYVKALADPHLSEYFRKFRSLGITKQVAQHKAAQEKEFINTIFWQDVISENQTVEDWQSLPPVYDPADPDCQLEYKSTTVGIVPQLAQCGRVVDFSGAPLDLDEVLAAVKTLGRYRGADANSMIRVDCWTDHSTLASMRQVMVPYLKTILQIDNVELFYQPGQKMEYVLKGDKRTLFSFEIFQFLNDGIELAVMADYAFDDHLAAFPAAHKNAARYLMFLDWSDIDIFLGGSKSVTRQTNVADELYQCVIDPVMTRYLLQSKTISVFIHDPNRHLIYKNFGNYCPTVTATTCTDYE